MPPASSARETSELLPAPNLFPHLVERILDRVVLGRLEFLLGRFRPRSRRSHTQADRVAARVLECHVAVGLQPRQCRGVQSNHGHGYSPLDASILSRAAVAVYFTANARS